jgi:trimeric autotransporter adhesin
MISAGSGLPESPVYVAPVQGTGISGTIRPEYTGAPLYSAPSGFFLNPASYIAPLPGTWGNAARDSIIGPSQFSLGAGLTRNFRLTDRFNADFRLDASNALNHVNYTSWNTNVNSSQFGLPTLANTMRRVQASIRVRF